jgi:drug/metabolite transporter (DMT)-like permease
LSVPFAKALIDAGWSSNGALLVRLGGGLDWRGQAWGLSAAVCAAAYFLLADRADTATPPMVLAGVGMVVGTVIALLLGLTGVLPVVLPTRAHGVPLAGVDVGWPFAAAFLVLVPTVLAYLTGIAAVRRIGAPRASLVGLLEVVSSALGSWLLLGEVPTAVQAAGGALLLAGGALLLAGGALLLAGGALLLAGVALTQRRPRLGPADHGDEVGTAAIEVSRLPS